jgi:hypothetical protein
MANVSSAAAKTPFRSELAGARERFLAQVLVHAFEDGWRTPDDFIREFPPTTVMEALTDADALRARILVTAAGVHEKLAQKKSIRSAGEDLALALEEGVTDPAAVLDIFTPDDRVRYLEAERLWTFLTAGDFWKTRAQDSSHKRAVARMTFILERALAENLITLKDVSDGVTFEEISERLPVSELRRVVTHALKRARSGEPLTETSFTEVVPLPSLVGYVPLEHMWRGVVVEKLAAPLGFVKGDRTGASRKPDASAPAAAGAAPGPAPAPAKDGKREASKGPSSPPKNVPAPAPAQATPATKPAAPRDVPGNDSAIDVDVGDLEFDAGAAAAGGDSPPADRPPVEDESRNKALQRLRDLDRLPPNHEQLTLPILLSVESMYADLLEASSDDQRESIIRDSFPNEGLLRTAMLALIELLDPSINTNEPLIRDADVDSLIKIVLFEERHRYEQAHGQRSSPPQRGRSMPPPLPGRE